MHSCKQIHLQMHWHGRDLNEEDNGCFAERRSKIMKMRINIWLDYYIIMKLLSKKLYPIEHDFGSLYVILKAAILIIWTFPALFCHYAICCPGLECGAVSSVRTFFSSGLAESEAPLCSWKVVFPSYPRCPNTPTAMSGLKARPVSREGETASHSMVSLMSWFAMRQNNESSYILTLGKLGFLFILELADKIWSWYHKHLD